jgi:hypothetical protein
MEHVDNMKSTNDGRWAMMDNQWARLLAYVTGLVNQRLFLQERISCRGELHFEGAHPAEISADR